MKTSVKIVQALKRCTVSRITRHASRIAVIAAVSLVTCHLSRASAQVYDTYSSNMLTGPVVCQSVTTNLAAGQYNTNRIWQNKNLGISVCFWGGSASNTGPVGFQFAVLTHAQNGANGQMTTTRPFTFTSTANGTTPVVDWFVLPNYTIGPADAISLVGITNALANVNTNYANSGVTVSNVWLETDTRP